jgi:PKD repeat protein
VALSTDLGSFGVDGAGKPLQLQSLALDTTGKAQTSFFPGATLGTAHILAQVDTSTAKLNLSVKAPPPFFITSVTPNFGSPDGGTPVTLTGSGFLAPVRVTFGDVVATVVSVSDTALQVLAPRPAVPPAVGSTLVVGLTVTNNLGKTPVADTLTGAYTYTNGTTLDRPVVLSVSPNSGPNAGGTTVDLRGSGFALFSTNNEVLFGVSGASGFQGLPADILSSSPTDLQVVSPNVALLQPALINQQVDIQVRNLSTGFSTTVAAAFRYLGKQLAATALTPASGPYTGGTTVTISGQGFAAPVEVQFGGTTQSVDSVKPATIVAHTVAVAVAGCKPPSGPLTVKNLNTGETATTGLLFTYTVPQPAILQVTPTAGKQAGGDSLSITGRGFDSNLRVTVGGTVATGPQVSADGTSVTVTTPVYSGAFDAVACDDNGDGQMGMRSVPKAVDVQVTSLATGCSDTFAKAFTYNPTDASCRGDVKGPPVADFTFAANFLTVSFSDRSTGGTPSSWLWDFGDPQSGGADSSTSPNPSHTFSGPGTYVVQLTAKNSAGSSNVAKQVSVVALKADFTFSISSQTVTFTDTSTGPPALWSWSFGDGQTSSQQNPTHTYATSGTYTVVLQVSSGSTSSTTSRQVTIP